jgi:hypothetical protein
LRIQVRISSIPGAVLLACRIDCRIADSVTSRKGRAAVSAEGQSIGISPALAVFWRRLLIRTDCLARGVVA